MGARSLMWLLPAQRRGKLGLESLYTVESSSWYSVDSCSTENEEAQDVNNYSVIPLKQKTKKEQTILWHPKDKLIMECTFTRSSENKYICLQKARLEDSLPLLQPTNIADLCKANSYDPEVR